jgi:hypothetical protein
LLFPVAVKCQSPRFHNAAFNSMRDAVEHLIAEHRPEVKARQAELKKARDSKKSSKARADSLKDVDLADERSIAQKMVGEMLETYQQKRSSTGSDGFRTCMSNV